MSIVSAAPRGGSALTVEELIGQARLACSSFGRVYDKEDLVQDAMIKVLKRRDRLDMTRSKGEQRRYVRQIARREIIDIIRRRSREELHLQSFVTQRLVETPATPDLHLEADEILREVFSVQLSGRERQAFSSLFEEDRKDHCRTAMCTARTKVRQHLKSRQKI